MQTVNMDEPFDIFAINNYQTLTSQILTELGPLEEKLDFFSPLGFEAKSDFDHKTSKINSHSVRTSKRYLNYKSPINGAENFESYLSVRS